MLAAAALVVVAVVAVVVAIVIGYSVAHLAAFSICRLLWRFDYN